MEVSNNLLAALVVFAMAISITGTMSMLSIIPGKPGPITGMQTTQQSGMANASLSSEVHITLPVQIVNFGTIAKGSYNDTTDFQPHPFILRNNGSAVINVSIGEATLGSGSGPLWTYDDDCESCFQYNSTPNGTSGALNYAAWRNFDTTGVSTAEAANAGSLSVTNANLVWNLTNSATEDARDLYVHLNITPPSSELGGYKEATIYFLAGQG